MQIQNHGSGSHSFYEWLSGLRDIFLREVIGRGSSLGGHGQGGAESVLHLACGLGQRIQQLRVNAAKPSVAHHQNMISRTRSLAHGLDQRG